MTDEQKAETLRIIGKAVGEYTQEESDFMTDMMRRFPIDFCDILDAEVAKLRSLADSLKGAKQILRASDSKEAAA